MAIDNTRLRETGGLNAPPIDRWVVASGTTNAVEPGEFCKQNAQADENVIILVDQDLTIGTDQPLVGLSAGYSSETASAAGYVEVYTPLMNLLYGMYPETSGACDTQSEIDALIGDSYSVALTSNVFTLDTADPVSSDAFIITGGNPDIDEAWFRVRLDATRFGRAEV